MSKLFGTADNAAAALIDVVDGLTFGYAKRTLVDDLVKKYNIDYALAVTAVDQITRELNQLGTEISELRDKISRRDFGANPMGVTYHRLQQQLGANGELGKKEARYKQLTDDLSVAQKDVSMIDEHRRQSTGDMFIQDKVYRKTYNPVYRGEALNSQR